MIIENWKFLINRLMIFIGMIASFISATIKYSSFVIELFNNDTLLAIISLEFVSLAFIFLLLLKIVINFIKDNKESRGVENGYIS